MVETTKRYRSPDDATDVFYTDGTVDYDRVQGNNPLAGGEYPKALYRAGGSEEVHGHKVDTTTVFGADEEEALTSDGWRTTPAKAAALGKQLLEEEAAKPDPRDSEIARLRAELEKQTQGGDDRPRRGRPPNIAVAPESETA